MVLEFVAAIFSIVVDNSIAPIGRQISYVFNYSSNMENLKNQLEKLTETKEQVQHSVDAATRNGEEIGQDVHKWLTSVNKISEDAGRIIIIGKETEQLRCFKGLCPNLKLRHRLSKKATKEAKNVSELQGECIFNRVGHRVLPQRGIKSVKDYEVFESRMPTWDGLMEALRDPNINMAGVYGMGGVGKTTLVKEVANKAVEENLFDAVVMTTVSQMQDIKMIQGEIADKLGLEFHEESVQGRADRLCGRLKKERRILIILDDIWKRLDLEAVGIPFGEDHKGCKILLTSRNQNVLSREMYAQFFFSIDILPEEEVWALFKKMAGDSVENPDLQSVAIEVAKSCAGMPISIVTVARTLKN